MSIIPSRICFKSSDLAVQNPTGAFLLAEKSSNWLVTVGDMDGHILHARIFLPYKCDRNPDPELCGREETISAVQRFATSCGLNMQVTEGVPGRDRLPNLYCEAKIGKD